MDTVFFEAFDPAALHRYGQFAAGVLGLAMVLRWGWILSDNTGVNLSGEDI